MTSATMEIEADIDVMAEIRAREVIRPWHELDYAAYVTDSDRILADALTPHAAAMLMRLAAAQPAAPRLHCPASVSWSVSSCPVPERQATQRSPPRSE
ncbi:hypothetical protein ACFWCF_23495 [Rhodococcus sp. NPDC060090]|uniref:hypothetical protein n=1 Tax=Rhodococcus sp. NPDC060090 TaxID=3347056 RepID=UPI0036606C93